jgi:acyl-coenzyme A thioesterase PaaI-like protein
MKFNLVRAITPETGEVVAEGRVLHRGRRVATAEGTLKRAEDGKLLAHGTTTCMILAAEAAG